MCIGNPWPEVFRTIIRTPRQILASTNLKGRETNSFLNDREKHSSVVKLSAWLEIEDNIKYKPSLCRVMCRYTGMVNNKDLPTWVIVLNVLGALLMALYIAMYFKLGLHKLNPDLLERVKVRSYFVKSLRRIA